MRTCTRLMMMLVPVAGETPADNRDKDRFHTFVFGDGPPCQWIECDRSADICVLSLPGRVTTCGMPHYCTSFDTNRYRPESTCRTTIPFSIASCSTLRASPMGLPSTVTVDAFFAGMYTVAELLGGI